MYYFAYGSNMRPGQMAWRCPAARPVCKAFLEDYHFRINKHGAATIQPMTSAAVIGVVWRCTRACIKTLDKHEGVAQGTYRRDFLRLDLDGKMRNVLVYIAKKWQPSTSPARGYLSDFVIGGGIEFGLEEDYLDTLWGWQGDHVLKKGRRRPLIKLSQWRHNQIKQIANSPIDRSAL